MKIVDRKTFLALPSGTVFSKYQPCFFGPMEIKDDTLEHCNDFLSQCIADAIACTGSEDDFCDKLDEAQETGCSLSMDFDCLGRAGCFNDDQLFAVWERADVEALIVRLTQTLLVLP